MGGCGCVGLRFFISYIFYIFYIYVKGFSVSLVGIVVVFERIFVLGLYFRCRDIIFNFYNSSVRLGVFCFDCVEEKIEVGRGWVNFW